MKILILIVTLIVYVHCKRVKIPAKRAILGQNNGHNSIANPNKNAYLPPPIQQYPVEQPHTLNVAPATDHLPQFQDTRTTHEHISTTQNGFVPVANVLNSQHESQFRAAGYLPPTEEHDRDHESIQHHQSQQPSVFRGADYLPPKSSHLSGHGSNIQQPVHSQEHLLQNHHVENQNPTYNAPGYLPPVLGHQNHAAVQLPSEGSYKAAGYLPPERTNSAEAYNAPGYLPPVPDRQSVSARVPSHIDFEQSHNAYKAAGYLPPVSSSNNHEHEQIGSHSIQHANHQNSQVTDTQNAYKAAGYLPPVSVNSYEHQQVGSHSDQHAHDQHGQNVQIPHTVYGTPQSQSYTNLHVPSSANIASVNLGSQYAPSKSYSNGAQPNYSDFVQTQNGHNHQQSQTDHHQQIQNTAYSSHSTQHEPYAPAHYNRQESYSPQLSSIQVPHEYIAPLPMYSSNPTTQYAAEAPTYDHANNGYLPPHTDLLPPKQHHEHLTEININNHVAPNTAGHTNNDYLPPNPPQNDLSSTNDLPNHLQNSGHESSQYASSFPTYSSHHDGYAYSKPAGAGFEDGHHNLSPQNTYQPDLHVIHAGSEGGNQREVKIIRIIDETILGAAPNIRTLKIIKETVEGEPHHNNIHTIRIISEPLNNLQVSNHVSHPITQTNINVAQAPSHINVPQIVEQHNDLKVARAESSGENVQGGYLPPSAGHISSPIIQSGIPPPIPQPLIQQIDHTNGPPPIVHVPVPPHPAVNQPHSIPEERHPVNTAEYLPPLTQNVQNIVTPGQGQPYLPPLSAASTHTPTNDVRIIRIVHNTPNANYDQQQDAIYAGVAEQNGNDIKTIRVIHQQEADTSGRYGYPSPQINSVKLLRYYRRY